MPAHYELQLLGKRVRQLDENRGMVVRIFSSGLAFRFFLFFVAFGVVAAFWGLLDHFGLLESTLPYSGSLTDIGLIVGFVYNYWLRQAFDGYMDPPKRFRGLLNEIKTFGHRAFDLVHARIACMDESDEDDVRRIRCSCLEICKIDELLRALCFYIDRLYLQARKRHDHEFPYVFQDMYRVVTKRRMVQTTECSVAVISELTHSLETLRCCGALDADVVNYLIANRLDPINDALNGIDVATSIKTPGIFGNHINLILAVYFVIYIPYRIAIQAGLVTMAIYPIQLVLLTGPVIIRGFMKDPFDPQRPWPENKFYRWCAKYQEDIQAMSGAQELAEKWKLWPDQGRPLECCLHGGAHPHST